MARYIDADVAIDAANRLSLGETDVVRLSMKIVDYLNRMPAADVAPVRRGHWEPNNDRYGWACTACGHFIQRDFVTDITITSELLPRYCQNCGAKMDGGAIGDQMEDE